MTTNTLIESFESEREQIRAKLAELHEREEFLQKAIAEIRRAAPGGRDRGPAGKKTATKKKARSRGRSKGGMTVKDAILKVVGDAKEPAAPAEIIPATVKLSGGAEASIRTQLNNLSRSGELKQVPHEGRGFKYTIGTGAAAPAKKTSGKKKTGGKQGPSRRKESTKSTAPKAEVEAEPAPAAKSPADQPPEA